jgi:MFS family permease
VHYLSWHWVFYINIPFGIAAAVLIITSLHERIEKKPHRLDFLGAGLLTAGVVSLLLATSRISLEITVGTTIAAIVLLGAFVQVERRAAEPVLPLSLFARPVMFVSSMAGAIIGGAMIATLTYVPLYVQGVLRGTPTQAGSAITPMVVGWPIASALCGRLITRVGFRPLVWGGLAITAGAATALALFAQGSGIWGLGLATAMFGVGMGFANTALLIAVQTSVSWDQRGIATASAMFFRTIGGALAVGVMGGVISAALSSDASIPPDAANELLSLERGRALDPGVLAHLGDALAHGLGIVFWIIAAMAITAFVASIFFPRVSTAPQERPAPDEGPPSSAPVPPPAVGG